MQDTRSGLWFLVLCSAIALVAPGAYCEEQGEELAISSVEPSFGEVEPGREDGEETEKEPSDLTLRNFFTAGWDHQFTNRSRFGRAPRFHFFTTRQPFLDREIRTNYNYQYEAERGEADSHQLQWELEIPFNRRYMIDFEPGYFWLDGKGEAATDRQGLDLIVVNFFQLVDTYDSTLNFQFGIVFPPEIEELEQTELEFVIAGFEDLTRRFGLYRTSVSYFAQYQTSIGPNPSNESESLIIFGEDETESENILAFGGAVAKSFVDPDARHFKDFTLFVENFNGIQLDGENSSSTLVTFTPGMRWNLWKEESPWWLMTGVEIPVTGPHEFDFTVRISLIHWFD